MSVTLDLGPALGMLGVGFTFASFVMKRMVSLRVLALVANACFIAYGLVEHILPSLLLNGALLPVNARRLWEIRNSRGRSLERPTSRPSHFGCYPTCGTETLKQAMFFSARATRSTG